MSAKGSIENGDMYAVWRMVTRLLLVISHLVQRYLDGF